MNIKNDPSSTTEASRELRHILRTHLHASESQLVRKLATAAELDKAARQRIVNSACHLVKQVRQTSDPALMESFLTEYGLSTKEGIAMMCLAEALLRVPDSETVDALIHDKIVPADWGQHLGQSSSSLVNASTWALMLTGSIITDQTQGIVGTLHGVIKRVGEPVIRTAVNQAIRELGNQFVLGEDILKALKNSQKLVSEGYTYSYDMLGEAALTDADAKRYHLSYSRAISTLAQHCDGATVAENPGISVKLSALFPRYEVAQRERVMVELTARTRSLAMLAKSANIGFNIDAEEADRLDLSLDVIEAILKEPSLAGWNGFGVVVQAYSRRASAALDCLYDMACRLDRKIMVRLVKGAYWDTEIKQAQVEGLDGFPVFTRKSNTDISYISCARQLFSMTDRIYPQFATHNAHSIAAILDIAKNTSANGGISPDDYEFQRLHGMGDALHKIVHEQEGTRCRIYAPVGAHEDLLAYLVRRLLENGANSSFVNQLVDESVSPEEIAADPFDTLELMDDLVHPLIPPPADLFLPERPNSKGFDFSDPLALAELEKARLPLQTRQWQAYPLLGDTQAKSVSSEGVRTISNPANLGDVVGFCRDATEQDVETAYRNAASVFEQWSGSDVGKRAALLAKVADLMEENHLDLIELTCREAGKTLNDSIAEIREAVDFLRYYAAQAQIHCGNKTNSARGTFVCISPWNFPLAIFTGQIAAALAAGNCVIAKPAEQTPLIAAYTIDLFHRAGVDKSALQLVPGPGSSIGAALVSDARLAGVCFTGSTATAQRINNSMATHCNPQAPLIAETGGLNAMIVDSTALPEQAIASVIESAFQSAGQRCSALRVLYVQSDVYDRFLDMLCGAMDELRVAEPRYLSTDLGPLIDEPARQKITQYCKDLTGKGRLLHTVELDTRATDSGWYLAPAVFSIAGISELGEEIFGPILHIAQFDAADFFSVIDDINNSGYGLTFGLHTRVDERVQDVLERVHAGNLYINRNQIGAIVGSQPFGGKNLSGTGPKAGGPHYLLRFTSNKNCAEMLATTKDRIAAAGSNAGAAIVLSEGSITQRHLQANIDEILARTLQQFDLSQMQSKLNDALLADDFIDAVVSAVTNQGNGAMNGQYDAPTTAKHCRSLISEMLNTISTHHHVTLDLPGATGESNRLSMEPAGLIMCASGGCNAMWIVQILQSILLGNRVIATGAAAVETCQIIVNTLSFIKPSLTACNGYLDLATLQSVNGLNGLAIFTSTDLARHIRQTLAKRQGAILPMITDPFDISPLISEKTLCIDTTAAGGNASLLAQAV